MIQLRVVNDTLSIDGKAVARDMPFASAAAVLAAYTAFRNIRENGVGLIRINEVDVYGLKGSCTLSFREGRLTHVTVELGWAFYQDLNALTIYQAVEEAARRNGETLAAAFGAPICDAQAKTRTYFDGHVVICTAVSRMLDSYSLTLRWNEETSAEGMGYCFCSKLVLEQHQRVLYLYREAPDRDDDSGWRFFSGLETDAYVNDPGNIAICAVSTVAGLDPDILPLLSSPCGSAFEREAPGAAFRPVSDV